MQQQAIFSGAALAALTLFSGGIEAQVVPGFPSFGPLDIAGATGSGQSYLGCGFLNNEIYVTGRGNAGQGNPPHTVYVLDLQGNLVRSFQQSGLANQSVWGWRDTATDNLALLVGSEGGIEVIDGNGNPVNQLLAQNGFQQITQPIVVSGINTHRALAYDPTGNGGFGSIFVGDFGGDILEAALDGTVLFTYQNTSSWSAYGIAIDAANGYQSLWINSVPNQGAIAEFTIDRATSQLTPTGREFGRSLTSAQGGLAFAPPLDGRGCGSDLLGIDQTNTLTGYHLDLWDGYAPTARLTTGVDGAARDVAYADYQIGANTSVEFESNVAGAMFFNFGPASVVASRPGGPIGPFRALWQFRLLTQFTNPMGIAVDLPVLANTPLSIPSTFVDTIGPDVVVNAQVIAMDMNVPRRCARPLTTSNVNGIFTVGSQYLVQARGTNSFNSDTGSGFFTVTNSSPDPIVELTFDWVNSSNPNQATMEFDTDQIDMADLFEGGNSTASGCSGTYRNNCDTVCGLIYDNQNTVPATPCDANANTGWIGANPGNGTEDWRTLTWRFNNFTQGKAFEVDIDTDGGAGITGDSMAGMVVTIRTQGGQVFTGELVVIEPQLSQVSF